MRSFKFTRPIGIDKCGRLCYKYCAHYLLSVRCRESNFKEVKHEQVGYSRVGVHTGHSISASVDGHCDTSLSRQEANSGSDPGPETSASDYNGVCRLRRQDAPARYHCAAIPPPPVGAKAPPASDPSSRVHRVADRLLKRIQPAPEPAL